MNYDSNEFKNNNNDSDNLVLENVKDKNNFLVFKICLPIDTNILAIAIPNKSNCKKVLIDYLDSQDEVLQPYTISESLNPTKTIDLYLKKVEKILKQLKGEEVVDTNLK